jgi:hypothetical protein
MFGDCQIVSLAIDVGNAIPDFLKAQERQAFLSECPAIGMILPEVILKADAYGHSHPDGIFDWHSVSKNFTGKLSQTL